MSVGGLAYLMTQRCLVNCYWCTTRRSERPLFQVGLHILINYFVHWRPDHSSHSSTKRQSTIFYSNFQTVKYSRFISEITSFLKHPTFMHGGNGNEVHCWQTHTSELNTQITSTVLHRYLTSKESPIELNNDDCKQI